MVCPFKKCQVLHSLNSLNGVKSHYNSKNTHLAKAHGDNLIGQRLIKRWQAIHSQGGCVLMSAEDLDKVDGCELKLLEKDLLDANLRADEACLDLDLRELPVDHKRQGALRPGRREHGGCAQGMAGGALGHHSRLISTLNGSLSL